MASSWSRATRWRRPIKDGQQIGYDSGAYASADPQRGDVVVFVRGGVSRILRVIGLPGETVAIAGGSVTVNGSPLSEPYLPAGTRTDSPTASFRVPSGSYFMLADNRAKDVDSRGSLGFVARSELTGRLQV